jgi:hypothetical protein
MGYYVYIIVSEAVGKYYTGLSDYKLIFCSWFESRIIAREIEKYLKSGCGREFRDNLVK